MHGKDTFDRLAVMSGTSRGIGAAVASLVSPACGETISIGRSKPQSFAGQFVQIDFSHQHLPIDVLQQALEGARSCSEWWYFDMAGVLSTTFLSGEGVDEKLRDSFQINVIAPLTIGGLVARTARRSTVPLHIVHLTSGAAHRAIPRWGAYCASKSAAAMGWKTLAQENDHVTVHLIDPGAVDTGMQADLRFQNDPAAASLSQLVSAEKAAESILRKSGFVA